MAQKTIPEEKVRQFVAEQVGNRVSSVLKRQVREQLEKQLESKIAKIIQDILAELDDRGVDSERTNVDVVGITQDCVVEAMFGSDTSKERTAKIPVGGRSNREVTTEITLPEQSNPPTKTVEVPIRGGNVKDPETMEIEVPNPGPVDLNATERVLDEVTRMNQEQQTNDADEYDSEDIPPGGLPYYQ